MARRSGASSKSMSKVSAPTKTASAPAPVKKAAPAPAPATNNATPAAAPQPVVIQGPGLLSNIVGTMAGAAAGHVVGHALVGGASSLFGSKDEVPQQQQQFDNTQQYNQNQQAPESTMCNPLYKSFMTCLEKNQNDVATCQWAYDSFLECKKNPTTFY
ncbi:hypothetical protein DICPUDRAFT_91377 [Dictyostelium purpureum]|uniref:CHCH domain-containing protein n=1 Tax=Dictyostelium purpureum TaxID=5786 RepID=F0ZBD8_DICPU|nr:uncharacterized protein DICPUDRAFT_91377 [Dictyostelium purpureum]EGC38756.1 hypothetical protein DICPUDRAFT_91377 [Dictyostelium purpureum]|eukprot:XP_003284747.1 hypothetical protein DICPUDRAFT_91377 [Dictyostelium purpureum]